jgi:GTPase SAR1 family protein
MANWLNDNPLIFRSLQRSRIVQLLVHATSKVDRPSSGTRLKGNVVKNKTILFLIYASFLSTFTTTLYAMEKSASKLVKELHDGREDIAELILNHPLKVIDAEKILLIGDTGSGKSTLVHILLKKNFYANDAGQLYTTEEVAGSRIGQGLESQTDVPSFHQLPQGSILCDLPGLKDTKGAKNDILQAYSLYLLLQKNAKILLVVSESSLTDKANEFRALIDKLTKMITVYQLKNSAALVITKYGSKRFFDAKKSLEQLSCSPTLSNDSKELLKYWLNEEGENKIINFPAPIERGFYEGEPYRRSILQAINDLRPMLNPKIEFFLSADCKQHLDNLLKSIYEELSTKLREFVAKRILPLIPAAQSIEVEELRTAELYRILLPLNESLDLILYPTKNEVLNFVTLLLEQFSADESDCFYLNRYKNDIIFISKIITINYSVAEWAGIIKPVVDMLNSTIAAEKERTALKGELERIEQEKQLAIENEQAALRLAEVCMTMAEPQPQIEESKANPSIEITHVASYDPTRIGYKEFIKMQKEGKSCYKNVWIDKHGEKHNVYHKGHR